MKRYILSFVLACAASVLAIAALNWAIDPFNVLGRNSLGIHADTERTAKARAVTTFPYDGLILGSSVIANVDPAHIRGGRFFNAAFGSAVPEEYLWFLDNYLKPGKTVLLTIDFSMVNKGYFNLIYDSRKLKEAFNPDPYRYLLSANVALDSLMTAISAIRGKKPAIREDGGRPEPLTGSPDLRALADIPPVPIGRGRYKNFTYAPERIEIMQSVRRILEARGARFAVILTPLHSAVRRSLEEMGLSRHLDRLRSDLKAVLGPCFLDYSAGPYGEPENYNGGDLNHIFSSSGEALINEALATGTLCGATR